MRWKNDHIETEMKDQMLNSHLSTSKWCTVNDALYNTYNVIIYAVNITFTKSLNVIYLCSKYIAFIYL